MAPRSLDELRAAYSRLRDQLVHMPDVVSIGLADNRILVVVDYQSDLHSLDPIDGVPVIVTRIGRRARTQEEGYSFKKRRQ